jgi:uncharacterized membrane protein HdeD (DUF308 family)
MMLPRKEEPRDIPPIPERPRAEAGVPRPFEAGLPGLPGVRGVLESLAGNWGWILVRGVLGVIFGILCFAWPGISLIALVFLFGAYAFMDGAIAIAAGLSPSGRGRDAALVILGVLGLIAGVFAFLWPGITAVALLLLIGVWAIIKGIVEIVEAIRLRKEIEDEWLFILSGLLSFLFGVIVLARPGVGALAIVWLIGAWALVFGAITIALAFRLRRAKKELEKATP